MKKKKKMKEEKDVEAPHDEHTEFYTSAHKRLKNFFMKFMFKVTVEGEVDALPEGAAMICCNHTSAFDVFVLFAATPKQINFMAKKELFKVPLVSSVIKAVGAFPVDRSKGDVSAIRKGISLLKEGGTVGVFPQGTRCPGVRPSPEDSKLHSGAAMMAARAQAAIVPVTIQTKKFKVGMFKKVRVCYGKPISYEDYKPYLEEGGGGYDAITRLVFKNISEMVKD